MADRYLLQSSNTDGYLLEDGSGVLLLEQQPTLEIQAENSVRGPTFPRAKRSYNPAQLGTALVLLASIVTTAPFNQEEWPVPRGKTYSATQRGHTDSFKLPLQTISPNNQKDWPNPRGPVVTLRGSVSGSPYGLIAVVQAPFVQEDWPNPRGRDHRLSWTDSFKLPLQAGTSAPFAQDEWRIPRAPRRFVKTYDDTQWGFTLPLQAGVAEPFAQIDWPNPRGAKGVAGFENQSLALSVAATARPISQYDWPVPKGPSRGRDDWSQSGNSLATTAPFFETEWPNPRGEARLVADWVTSSPYALTAVVQVPFAQTDWPNPAGERFSNFLRRAGTTNNINLGLPGNPELGLVAETVRGATFVTAAQVGFTQNALTFATIIGTTPFNQESWPNPRGETPSIVLRTWIDVGKLPPKLVIPKNQFDWPVPRGPRRPPADWVRGEPLPQLVFVNTPPSGNQRDWPNPRGARRGSQDWIAGVPYALANTVVVVTKPQTPSDWPVPQRQRPIRLDFQDRNDLVLQSVAPLNPIAGQKLYRTFAKVSTTGPNLVLTTLFSQDVLPRNQYDWPVPKGRVPVVSLKTFTDSFKLQLTTIRPPSIQRDWPNPRGAQRSQFPQGFTGGLTALVIPQPAFLGPDPGCAIVGGYFSKGQWHTVIGTPCKPVKRRSYKEPGFSRQQYEDLIEAIRTGEYQPSQRKVKRWYEGGAFSRTQFDDIKATIRLEQETKAQQEKLAREALAFAEARAHEDRLAAIEAQAQALQAQNELQSLANQTEAAARLQALQRNIELSKAMAEFAKQAKLEEDDDEEAIRLLFDG